MTALQNLKQCVKTCESFALKFGKKRPRSTPEGRLMYNALRVKYKASDSEALYLFYFALFAFHHLSDHHLTDFHSVITFFNDIYF